MRDGDRAFYHVAADRSDALGLPLLRDHNGFRKPEREHYPLHEGGWLHG